METFAQYLPSSQDALQHYDHDTMGPVLYALLSTLIFSTVDFALQERAGKYYIMHTICNAAIITITIPDVVSIYTNPYTALEASDAFYASSLTYGLHFYHILMYFKKLRYDDWLHHGLMIFVALPLANVFGSVRLLGHSLFYTTGLPGMIDYACLALVRNKYMERMTEKSINRKLNIWIRNPGCTIHAFVTLINLHAASTYTNVLIGIVTSALVFWNGVYFMDQVVGNFYLEREKQKTELPRNYND